MRLLVIASMLAITTAASAQTVNIMPGPTRFVGQQQQTRIQVTTQVTSSEGSAQVNDQLALQDTLRRRLYEIAANECGMISEVFKMDCRMASLNINSNASQRSGSGGTSTTSTSNANYELSPRPQN